MDLALHILVIDDDLDFLAFMHDALDVYGCAVRTACSSRAAYDLVQREQFDAIILDVCIETAQSGWDVLTYLQLHPILHRIPVVICSAAYRDLESKEAWLRSREIGVLHKPFDIETLFRELEAVLASSLQDGEQVTRLASSA